MTSQDKNALRIVYLWLVHFDSLLMISSHHCNNINKPFLSYARQPELDALKHWHFHFCIVKCLYSYKKQLAQNNFSRIPKLDFPFQSLSYKPKITNRRTPTVRSSAKLKKINWTYKSTIFYFSATISFPQSKGAKMSNYKPKREQKIIFFLPQIN